MNHQHPQARAIASDLDQLVKRVDDIINRFHYSTDRLYRGSDAQEELRFDMENHHLQSELGEELESILWTLDTKIQIYADALGLGTVNGLLSQWRINKDLKFSEIRHLHTDEAFGFYSPAFEKLYPILSALLVLVSSPDEPAPSPEPRRGHETLEYALRAIAKICRDRDKTPSNEKDVQEVVRSHLEGIFPDFVPSPTIDKPLLKFKPDGGIPSLKSAIEIKFVGTRTEIATAIHGVMEDLSGYAQDPRWLHFYSLIYMTEPFAVEGQFRNALGVSGNAGDWTTIVVTGGGQRVRRKG